MLSVIVDTLMQAGTAARWERLSGYKPGMALAIRIIVMGGSGVET